jgi:hypothetical protein
MFTPTAKLVTRKAFMPVTCKQLIRPAIAALRRAPTRSFQTLPRSPSVITNKPTKIAIRLFSTNELQRFDMFDEKLNLIKEIEEHIAALEDNFQRTQEAYSAVGWETASDIDALFCDSKSRKQSIKEALIAIKHLTQEAKKIFETAASASDAMVEASTNDKLDRLAKNLIHVEVIEESIADLEANYAQKQESYTNVGWETADDIHALFADSKLKKDNIKNSVAELKAVIQGFTME